MEQRETYQTNAIVRVDDLKSIGEILARSGYFSDAKDEAKAIVKVLAGQELGLGPVASMTGIHIIQGKPSIGAALMAALVKRSGRYDFHVRTLTDSQCSIEFFEHGKSIGVSSFTADDAKKAGTQNMGKYPKNMLYARAMSNGVKWFCPDVATGPIYEPGELGARVDYETGEIIDGEIIEETPETQAPPPPAFPNGRPWSPDRLREMIVAKSNSYRSKGESWMGPAPDGLRGVLCGQLDDIVGDTERRHTFLKFVTGEPSSKALDHATTKALMDWLEKSDARLVKDEANRVANAEIHKNAVGELWDAK
jgi:hypothetical protein